MEHNTVVYRHVRLDTNEVFYVGIGNKYRPYAKGMKRSDLWNNIVNKTDYRIDILFDNLTKEEACKKEIELIKLYGRRDLGLGTLVNLTDGGETGFGQKVSEETRKKLSNMNKGDKHPKWGVKLTEQQRTYLSEINKGNKHFLGRKHSEETRRKMSEAQKGDNNLNYGRILSEEHKNKLNSSWRGKHHTQETKEIISKSHSKPILQYNINGELIREFKSMTEAGKEGFIISKISQVCNGKRNKHKGHIWKFKDVTDNN